MYHSALVVLKSETMNDAVSQMAFDLATHGHLQLAATVVIDPAQIASAEAVPLGATAFKARWDDTLKARAYESALKELDRFTQSCEERGISCTTSLREGPLDREIPLALEAADMLVVNHGDDTDVCSEAREDVSRLDGMLKASARPCLIVPCTAREVQRIVVAYDGSLPSGRALHDFAVSGLWQDLPVDVLSLAADGSQASELAERGANLLNTHGYAAVAHPMVGKFDVANSILEYIKRTGAGVLVMGAYGKPRWHEFFFGTVTRSILRATTVPVFLSR